jgi:hypothetical protein
LIDEYAETKSYVAAEKPYWVYLDAQTESEITLGTFQYFPEAHYKRAIDHAIDRVTAPPVEADGGDNRLYFWYNTETNAVVQEFREEEPYTWFGVFEQQEEALSFMQEYRDDHNLPDISDLQLYEANVAVVGDGEELLE